MIANRRYILTLIVCCVIHLTARAQVSFIDTTFGTSGKVFTNFSSWEYSNQGILQPDGKIILVGSTDTLGPLYTNFAIARYEADGALDTTFSTDGKDTIDFNGYVDEAYDAALQPDGKIVVTGRTITLSSDNLIATLRYNTDGTLDTTFGVNGRANTWVSNSFVDSYAVAISPNGKIAAGGMTLTNTYNVAVAQLNADGSNDSTFGNNGVVITPIPGWQCGNDLVYQPDGKILVAGYHHLTANADPGAFLLIRYNTDGTLDSTFNGNGIVLDSAGGYTAMDMILLPNGKIIVGGSSGSNSISHFAMARYNTDGSTDSTFGVNGSVITPLGNQSSGIASLALLPNGNILATGYASTYHFQFTLVCYTAGGIVDSTFGVNGVIHNILGASTNNPNTVMVQPSGKIIVSGWSAATNPGPSPDFSMIRYHNYFTTEVTEAPVPAKGAVIIPNPVTSVSKVCFKNPDYSPFLFTVYNVMGDIVEQVTTTSNEIFIAKGNKRPGIYFYSLQNSQTKECVFGKVVIE